MGKVDPTPIEPFPWRERDVRLRQLDLGGRILLTVVIAELNWIRKTVRPAEFPEGDGDALKGVGQLQSIRDFLAQNPHHLRALRRLLRPSASARPPPARGT